MTIEELINRKYITQRLTEEMKSWSIEKLAEYGYITQRVIEDLEEPELEALPSEPKEALKELPELHEEAIAVPEPELRHEPREMAMESPVIKETVDIAVPTIVEKEMEIEPTISEGIESEASEPRRGKKPKKD